MAEHDRSVCPQPCVNFCKGHVCMCVCLCVCVVSVSMLSGLVGSLHHPLSVPLESTTGCSIMTPRDQLATHEQEECLFLCVCALLCVCVSMLSGLVRSSLINNRLFDYDSARSTRYPRARRVSVPRGALPVCGVSGVCVRLFGFVLYPHILDCDVYVYFV